MKTAAPPPLAAADPDGAHSPTPPGPPRIPITFAPDWRDEQAAAPDDGPWVPPWAIGRDEPPTEPDEGPPFEPTPDDPPCEPTLPDSPPTRPARRRRGAGPAWLAIAALLGGMALMAIIDRIWLTSRLQTVSALADEMARLRVRLDAVGRGDGEATAGPRLAERIDALSHRLEADGGRVEQQARALAAGLTKSVDAQGDALRAVRETLGRQGESIAALDRHLETLKSSLPGEVAQAVVAHSTETPKGGNPGTIDNHVAMKPAPDDPIHLRLHEQEARLAVARKFSELAELSRFAGVFDPDDVPSGYFAAIAHAHLTNVWDRDRTRELFLHAAHQERSDPRARGLVDLALRPLDGTNDLAWVHYYRSMAARETASAENHTAP